MKLKEPLVSVLMPNYNNEKYLSEAIESILNQTYKNFEFLIIDDCSTDNSWEIISNYAKKDKRIKAFRNEKNLKIVKTRNKLFELVSDKSKYFAIFDGDDISMLKRLEKEVGFMEENRDCGVVGSNILLIDENSKVFGKRKYYNEYKVKDKNILLKSPIAQPVGLIRKEILSKVGGKYSTDGKFDRSRDFDLWVKINNISKIVNLRGPLLKYRISSTQGKNTHLKETIKSTIQIQKKWLFKKEYFSFKVLVFVFFESILLLLPKIFILWVFKKVEFRK